MKQIKAGSRRVSIALAFLLSSPSALGLTIEGFDIENSERIESEILYLKSLGADKSNVLSLSGLPSNGSSIFRKVINTFGGVISSNATIRGCIKPPAMSASITSCELPFSEWSQVYPTQIQSVVSGIGYIHAQADSKRDFGGSFFAGPTRSLALENKKPLLIINQSYFEESMTSDSVHAVGLLKLSGIVSAVRMHEAAVMGKGMPEPCGYGIRFCDDYRNGPVSQAGAFLIYAANECDQCSDKSKAVVFSLGLKTLAGAPGDSRIDPIELSKGLQGGVVKEIFPDSLRRKVRMKRLMHEGISPLM